MRVLRAEDGIAKIVMIAKMPGLKGKSVGNAPFSRRIYTHWQNFRIGRAKNAKIEEANTGQFSVHTGHRGKSTSGGVGPYVAY